NNSLLNRKFKQPEKDCYRKFKQPEKDCYISNRAVGKRRGWRALTDLKKSPRRGHGAASCPRISAAY
ncbi:MAG: hypothetical protein P9D89_11095, partial [Candidatus Contendobacter sp.]|nr:hypothetical protein [Candidatus Contendobacter sp.]